MAITMRGTCVTCRRRRRIRRDGLVRKHWVFESIEPRSMGLENYICQGSDQEPLELVKDPEVNWHCNTGCSGCRDMINYGV